MASIIGYLFFGIFAIAGIAAFIGSAWEPLEYWLAYGHWKEPPLQILFGSLFLLTHGGVGFGGLGYLISNRGISDDLDNRDTSKPWLSKTYWAKSVIEPTIGSSAKVLKRMSIYVSLISLVAIFSIYHCVLLEEYKALYGLAYPAVAIILYIISKRMEMRVERFGHTPLALNPYPPSIGGQFGGSIEVKLIKQQIKNSTIKIESIRTYRSGDDTKKESLWTESMVPVWSASYTGHAVQFVFDLPVGEGISQAEENDSTPRIQWSLKFEAELEDGTKIKRRFEDIPVFHGTLKSTIKEGEAYSVKSDATNEIHNRSLDIIMPYQRNDIGQYLLHYPVGRNSWSWILILIGALFITIGLNIPQLVFNIVFPFLGGITFLIGIYTAFNSLSICISPLELSTERYLFGLKIKHKKMVSYEFKKIEIVKSHSTQGKEITQYYNIIVRSNDGAKLTVVENIKGMGQAKLAIKRIEKMLGLSTTKY